MQRYEYYTVGVKMHRIRGLKSSIAERDRNLIITLTYEATELLFFSISHLLIYNVAGRDAIKHDNLIFLLPDVTYRSVT